MVINNEITLDISKQTQFVKISLPQGDAIDRVFKINLVNGVDEYIIPNTATVRFEMTRPDGSFIYNNCPVENNQAVLEITPTISAVDGRFPAQFRITDSSTGGLIKSFRFHILIHESVDIESAIVNTSEFTALQDMELRVGDVSAIVDNKVGNLGTLITTNKTNVVGAINEVSSQLADNVTQLSKLETTKAEKTEVQAIDLRVDNLVIPLSEENSNIQVTDALVSSTKVKTFTTLKNRLEEIEIDNLKVDNASMKFKNLALLNEWTELTNNSNIAILNGITTSTVSTVATGIGLLIKTSPIPANHKIYISMEIKPFRNHTPSLYFNSLTNFNKPVTVGFFNKVSQIVSSTASRTHFNLYDNANTTTGMTVGAETQYKNILAINLTEIFGEGKEPDRITMDKFIDYLGGYFENELYVRLATLFDWINSRSLLESSVIPNTTQIASFNDDGSISNIVHGTVRTDTFTYTSNTITETRTLNNGQTLIIISNIDTLETEVI